jgi:NSS family neurotransmitter:Na+ symporter
VVTNGAMVSFMNCTFEFIAGLAIFSMLFAFTLYPGAKTGTLGMSLVVIPSGIANFPALEVLFAALFFFLLLIAGLTSSISIIESPVAALRDKFGWTRGKALVLVAGLGTIGSIAFALPQVLELDGKEAQPLGLSLLELFDHWAFGYSLLIVGLVEAIFIGHVYGIEKLRAKLNENARFKLGPWFDVVIKYLIPVLIGIVLLFNVLDEAGIGVAALGIEGKGFYIGDTGKTFDGFDWLPVAVFALWAAGTVVGAFLLTRAGGYDHEEGEAS